MRKLAVIFIILFVFITGYYIYTQQNTIKNIVKVELLDSQGQQLLFLDSIDEWSITKTMLGSGSKVMETFDGDNFYKLIITTKGKKSKM